MTDNRPIPPPPPARRPNPATGKPVARSRRIVATDPTGNATERARRSNDHNRRQSYRWWHDLMQPGYGR